MSTHGGQVGIEAPLVLDYIACTYGDYLLFDRGLIFYPPKLLLVNVLFSLYILTILHRTFLLVLYIIYFAIWFPVHLVVICPMFNGRIVRRELLRARVVEQLIVS